MNSDETQALGILLVGGLAIFGTIAAAVLIARAAKPVIDRVAAVDIDELARGFGGGLADIARRHRGLVEGG
ncbi:MAG: hypothetical protein E6J20_18340 [Chloroflexi bacterium]|nr:MAG: hypothetical protein E6J20_18340 [Chloroflexota bacterium]